MKNQKGFTLLVATVTTSILLIVSFVVVNVALKQLVLAYSGQESQFALYNADAGIECALYWDLNNGPVSAFGGATATNIQCNNQINSVGGGIPTGGAFSYKVPITFLRGRVVDTDNSVRTDFPVLVCANGSGVCNASVGGLNQSGAGAHVSNVNGYDINFFANSDCTGKLNWEMEKYVPSTGEMVSWVKVSNLSSSVDTTIYMCYGNSSLASDQSNKTAVWNSNYKGVWHLPDGSNLTASDSTINGANGAVTAATGNTGRIGGGASFSAGSLARINFGTVVNTGYTNFSASAWFKASSVIGTFFTQWDDSVTGPFILDQNGGGGKARACITTPGGFSCVNGTTNIADGNWHYLVNTWRSSDGLITLYVDGIAQNTGTRAGANTKGGDTMYLGDYTNHLYYTGSADEARISNSTRSADWIKTEYNNQSSPSTFETFGSESIGTFGSGASGPSVSTFQVNFPVGCAIVQVTKQPTGATVVESRGYNTCVAGASRKFERGISLTY